MLISHLFQSKFVTKISSLNKETYGRRTVDVREHQWNVIYKVREQKWRQRIKQRVSNLSLFTIFAGFEDLSNVSLNRCLIF